MTLAYAETLTGMMGAVARELLGTPNARLSDPPKGLLRFGSQGSIEVNTDEGWFADYEAKVNGGVLDLIEHKAGLVGRAAALGWLEDKGIKARDEDDASARSTFYDYRDENGEVVFRVERKQLQGGGKTFLQHGPDGNGGFACRKGCMQGVRQVLYNLPAILAADKSAIVFVVEGEKCADRLTKAELLATTNAAGALKFREALAPMLADRRVVILPDNDEAGRRHADDVLAKVGKFTSTVAVLPLPGAEKSDVFDWFRNGGSAFDLVKMAEAALEAREKEPANAGASSITIEHAADPVNLWARHEPPPLPMGLLPKVIEDYAVSQAELMGVDPAGLAMAALVICCSVITDRICVQVKRHDPSWRESARLWVALVGPPSRKKTPIYISSMRPLARIDGKLFDQFAQADAAYQALSTADRKATPAPKQKRARLTDVTIEAAQEVLKASPDGLLLSHDELSGWFGSMDKYAPGKGAMADRAFWLQSYNGGPYAVNRVGRGASMIPNLSVNLLGGIQPGPLKKVANDAVDDGLIQRLIPVLLAPSSVGVDAPRSGEVNRYEALVDDLYQLQPPEWDGNPIEVTVSGPLPLQFSPEAQVIRRELEHKHHEMMAAETVSGKLASHFGKYDGLFARLCVLWHCIENSRSAPLPGVITERTAHRVAEFLHTFIARNAIAFYVGILGLADDHEELVEIAAFILAHKKESIQGRDIQRASRTLRSLTGDEARLLCEKLESLGWLAPIDSPSRSRTPHWQVNPAVHRLFEEFGAEEAARRRRAQEAIREVLDA